MYQLRYSQKLPITLEEAWAFFSDPNNLRAITPDHLGFEMITPSESRMYAGQIIAYHIRPYLTFRLSGLLKSHTSGSLIILLMNSE